MKNGGVTIFFLAGSDGEHCKGSRFLAGSKKINLLLKILAGSGFNVKLINTSPAMGEDFPIKDDVIDIGSSHEISRLTVPTHKNARIGRLRNILNVGGILDSAVSLYGKPDLIWCYNAYSFEMSFARVSKNIYDSPVVLEFEDWHFARSTIFNPQSILDYCFWKICLSSIDHCYVVNPYLEKKMKKTCASVSLLPGIIDEERSVSVCGRVSKRRHDDNVVHVGYFGGLNKEKGGVFLIKLIKLASKQSAPLKFHITGHGPLAELFEDLSFSLSDTVVFYGTVEVDELYKIIGGMDVLLNPHKVNNGVFPFKIIEYIATGKRIVSAPIKVHDTGLDWMLPAIEMVELRKELWLDALLSKAVSNDVCDTNIVTKRAISECSFDSLGKKLPKLINRLVNNN